MKINTKELKLPIIILWCVFNDITILEYEDIKT